MSFKPKEQAEKPKTQSSLFSNPAEAKETPKTGLFGKTEEVVKPKEVTSVFKKKD